MAGKVLNWWWTIEYPKQLNRVLTFQSNEW
jgi:hypothetical protein